MKLFSAAAGLTFLTIATGMAVEYNDFNAPSPEFPGGTVITGIRGASATDNNLVVITGSYITGSGGATQPIIYEGSLSSPTAGVWQTLTPSFSGVTTATVYGPNTGLYDSRLGTGGIRAVGSYKSSDESEGNHGMMYTRIGTNGTETWTAINAPTSLTGGAAVKNTIAHSTMGNLVVGNYDTDALTGHAFIYDFAANPIDAYIKMTPVVAASITAYGIWFNGQDINGKDFYTIAGGYSDIQGGSLSGAYLVDYTPGAAEKYSNFTTFEYANNDADQIITHFNGIVATEDGFNLTGDHVTAEEGEQLGFFASIKRNSDGSFGTPEWTSINYPQALITSGNTVYSDSVLGVYEGANGSSSYIATVPEPSTYALIIAGLGALLFFRRRQAAAR